MNEQIEKNPSWPLSSLCDCGALPDSLWSGWHRAVAQGCRAEDGDSENCPRWQASAEAWGSWAPATAQVIICADTQLRSRARQRGGHEISEVPDGAFVLACPLCGAVRPFRGEHLGDCPVCGEHHQVTVERMRV